MNNLIRQFLLLAVCLLMIVPYPFAIVHAEADRLEQRLGTAPTVEAYPHQAVSAASSGVELVGGLGTWNSEQSSIVNGIAYIAAATDGLRVVDVHVPSAPTLLATLTLSGEAAAIYVIGTTAYVGDYQSGRVYIVDVSTPADPRLRSSFVIPQRAVGITVVGSLAYVAGGGGGLQIVDVSNLDHPVQQGSLYMQGYARDVAVLGSLAFIADEAGGLQIVDVSNPASPVLRSSISVNGLAEGLYVSGNTVYVAASPIHTLPQPHVSCTTPGGLRIVDVSDSAHPTLLGSIDTLGSAQNIFAVDGLAYVADGTSLQVFDVHNQRNPTSYASYATSYQTFGVQVQDNLISITGYGAGLQMLRLTGASAAQTSSLLPRQAIQSATSTAMLEPVGDVGAVVKTVTVSGTLAYIGESNQISILDVSAPAQPIVLARLPLSGNVMSIQVVGDRAFVANYSSMFQIVDVHDALHPRLISTLNTSNNLYDLQIVGNLAYVGGFDGLNVIDISNPDDPKLVYSPDAPVGTAMAVQVVGQYIYIAEYNGLRILDITNPTMPMQMSFLDVVHDEGGANAFGLYVANQFAYLADGGGGLWIINVSNPTHPRKVGIADAGYVVDLQVIGKLAYVVDRDSGVRIVDVSKATAPRVIGSIVTGEYPFHLQIVNNVMYVAGNTNGLQMFDMHDLDRPTPIGSYATTGTALQVSTENGFAYVATEGNGLQVVDVHTPGRPLRYGHLDLAGPAYAVQVVDHMAYVGEYTNGILDIVDVTTPSNPRLRSSIGMPRSAIIGIKAVGRRVYVAGGGFQIVDTSDLDHPIKLGGIENLGAESVDVVGTKAFVAGGRYGLQIIDVSNPAHPAVLGSAQMAEYAKDVNVVGSMAYVTTLPDTTKCNPKSGLRIYDVSDPAHPVLRGSLDMSIGARHVQVVGTLAYVVVDGQGVQVIDVSDPTHPFIQATTPILGGGLGLQVVDRLVYVVGQSAGLQILSTTPQFQPSATTINASGGEATSADGSVQLAFADNTFTDPVTILHLEMLPSQQSTQDDSPVVRSFLTEARSEQGQALAQVSKPFTFQLHYSDEQLAALGVNETYLNVALWNGMQWVEALPCAGCSVDTVNNTITRPLTTFGKAELVQGHTITSSPIISPIVTLDTETISAKEDSGSVNIAVTLSAPSSMPIRVDYATSDGSATAGQDYGATHGTLTFAPGATHATFSVPILNDTIHEADETAYLTLSNPVGATLGTTTRATLTIVDNDLGTASSSHLYLPLVWR